MKCVEFGVPDEFAFATVLTGCASISELKLGMQMHAGVMIVVGFEIECALVVSFYTRKMVETSRFQMGVIGALALSVASSVAIVICNKALMSNLGFPFMFVLLHTVPVLYEKYEDQARSCQRKVVNIYGNDVPACRFKSDFYERKIRRARTFTYEELERATGGFKEDTKVRKGSFSCVFKGILKDGTVVAVKRAIISTDVKKNSTEFHTKVDLLSRLNHAHLLNLLGYCEEGQERLLVYEFMAHGSLHQHLHGKSQSLKQQLDWV
ncbi:hypothetical protein IFM89_010819 [Coptis chinensis]|uniref:non-specific serine/threonine protein kinase n=1 Tax=Coptis chinensis TaxID=261450 RepID=A0A835ILR8_9MAGN|nr:hypothetical protein IFM89_010819 [Coptis chinensis]